MKINSVLKSTLVAYTAIGTLFASATINAQVNDKFYKLPGRYDVTAIEDQYCDPDNLKGIENYMEEASSKFFTWITGSSQQAHYEPIGEVGNYFGFAALRNNLRDLYNDPQADEGIREAFAMEVLELLDDSQRALMYELLDEHMWLVENFLEDRILFIDELWSMKDDRKISFNTVDQLVFTIGKAEGEMVVSAAEKYAEILATLTDSQLNYLKNMSTLKVSLDTINNTVLSPYGPTAQAERAKLSKYESEVMAEVASKLVSWATGGLKEAQELPPGKVGNFFGFSSYRYVDRTNVSRQQAAEYVWDVLDDEQNAILCGLGVNIVDYNNNYIDGRADLIAELFKLQENPSMSTNGLADRYAEQAGTGEGYRAMLEALTYDYIERTMSGSQKQALKALRK